MKKIITFLIPLILLIILPTAVNAKTTSFYEAEFIPNIWLNKRNPTNGLVYYNQARIFRETESNDIAYCLQPFVFFKSDESYAGYISPLDYTEEQVTDMSLIAHFGYGYSNHTDQKWYAITQFLIWKVAEPNGYYYFSNYKNGPEIEPFQEEISEILALVKNYKTLPSFNEKTYYIVEGESLILKDEENVLNNFSTTETNATIENNKLIMDKPTKGTHQILLERKNTLYNKPTLFYQSATSQDIMEVGDPLPISSNLTVNVVTTTIKVTKIDEETLRRKPQGDASLAGAKFNLYTTYGEYLKTITIGEDLTYEQKNLPFGTYYLKELTPGTGYTPNDSLYYFSFFEGQTTVKFNITNKVIKGKIQILKEFGYPDNFKPEKNISFNIYNKNNELVETITTNDLGIAEATLPYGQYKLVQITTSEGYEKIEPFYFNITEENTIYYQLKDYKIPVPNTHSESLWSILIKLIRSILWIKK